MVYYLNFYPIFSSSMYKNSSAIVSPGNSIPTSGTKIDGKYDAVMSLCYFIKKLKYLYSVYYITLYFIYNSYL